MNAKPADRETNGLNFRKRGYLCIQFKGLVIEIVPDARYRVQLDAGYEVLAYTVALLRWGR